ncbi:secondary thiamine-phosphate synthase enzyme YjbQ [Calorimonas adulescens]|jgi:conserved hypothetical protein TIGR00149|uniref:YjbQ family protein n=1 Tax=Calorimonas adulescens TaxID=2606906 RepID=A0A5D8Q8C1_9THEO|nr:secondary thiamine-phosphate synthase enzyme YjbQ [Calorimonas adulescens]MDI6601326.1 secondary thiamine-phosphate synthase enzyme YjbQ [Thermoanaerobacteraceae bacterium]TZE80722.1 YjbQ family protein [Calorimonas adulescens]
MKMINVNTHKRQEFVDITREIEEIVVSSGVKDGACLIYVPHTTAGVMINENADPDVIYDVDGFFKDMVPQSLHFKHREGNSDAHIKSGLIGTSLMVPISGGGLALGTWQGIYFAEFDGPRHRNVYITILKGIDND